MLEYASAIYNNSAESCYPETFRFSAGCFKAIQYLMRLWSTRLAKTISINGLKSAKLCKAIHFYRICL